MPLSCQNLAYWHTMAFIRISPIQNNRLSLTSEILQPNDLQVNIMLGKHCYFWSLKLLFFSTQSFYMTTTTIFLPYCVSVCMLKHFPFQTKINQNDTLHNYAGKNSPFVQRQLVLFLFVYKIKRCSHSSVMYKTIALDSSYPF